MKPYYEDDVATIYHGDCREVLPSLPKVDLVLTDPPFGIGNFVQVSGNIRGDKVTWNDSPPDAALFELLRSKSTNRIIWGANYFNCFEPNGGAIVWIKNQPMPDFSKAEVASCSFHKRVEIFTHTWTNFVNSKISGHPCERPVALYSWCLQTYSKSADLILDPFMGSGTTGVACAIEGRKFIGIEIEESYCELAVARIKRAQGQWAEIPRQIKFQKDNSPSLFDALQEAV